MDDASWAIEEFAAADLGDSRRNARLVDLASALGRHPTAALPQACTDAAQLEAAYSFFANEHITPAAILASHLQATGTRCATQPLILAVQDTTQLDYSHHPATTGLGPLATPTRQGLFAHSTVAFTPERLPLGFLAQEVWTRDPATIGKRAQRRDLPIAAKESQKWLTSLTAVSALAAHCPTTQFVSIGDREADIYDLFLVARPPSVDLLVRAAWDRRTRGDEHRLWARLAAAPDQTTRQVAVPRRGAQAPRPATLVVRWRAVQLRPPQRRQREALPDVAVWAVWAVEAQPPPASTPVEWLLLTSCAVSDEAGALEKLAWYAVRWGIEVVHKVLKSGCQIEARQLGSAARLERALAVYSVIAWRLLYSTLLARAVPDAPCTVVLEPEEWAALYCTIHQVATPAAQVPTLRQAVRWLAQLGGFLGRTRDGEPGVTVLWRGWQRLHDLTMMYRIMRPASRTNVLPKD